MPRYDFPAVSTGTQKGLRSLTLELDASLNDDEFAAVAGKLGTPTGGEFGPSWHGEFRQGVEVGEFRGEMSGLIGVHDYSKGPDTSLGHSVHFGIRLSRRPWARRKDVEKDWDRVAPVVMPYLAPLATDILLHLVVPRAGATVAVTLPIELGSTIAGFDEIRGFQLAKVSQESPHEPLYSVILQVTEKELSLAVSTEGETPLDSRMLGVAAERGLAIARLAVPKWEGM